MKFRDFGSEKRGGFLVANFLSNCPPEEKQALNLSTENFTTFFGCSATLGITAVQIEILGAKFQILGPRCAPHYFSGPSQNLLGQKKPIRAAAIRVVTRYIGCSTMLGITTVQIEILGAKFQVLSPRCALILRPKSKPAGREKPIRVAAIRVVTKYPNFSLQEKLSPENHSGSILAFTNSLRVVTLLPEANFSGAVSFGCLT